MHHAAIADKNTVRRISTIMKHWTKGCAIAVAKMMNVYSNQHRTPRIKHSRSLNIFQIIGLHQTAHIHESSQFPIKLFSAAEMRQNVYLGYLERIEKVVTRHLLITVYRLAVLSNKKLVTQPTQCSVNYS